MSSNAMVCDGQSAHVVGNGCVCGTPDNVDVMHVSRTGDQVEHLSSAAQLTTDRCTENSFRLSIAID